MRRLTYLPATSGLLGPPLAVGLGLAHALVVMPPGGRPLAGDVLMLPVIVTLTTVIGALALIGLDLRMRTINLTALALLLGNGVVVCFARVTGSWDLWPPLPLIGIAVLVALSWPVTRPADTSVAPAGLAPDIEPAVDGAVLEAAEADKAVASARVSNLREANDALRAQLVASEDERSALRKAIARQDDALDGRFQPVEQMGADVGQPGTEMWLAIDIHTEKEVAVKRFRLDKHLEGAARDRMGRELQGVSRFTHLRHPNVIEVLAVFFADGDGWIAMAKAPLSLKQHLHVQTVIDLGWALNISCDIFRGLDFCHGHGILHSDVKPANTLLLADGRAVLTDFGSAQWASLTRVRSYGRSRWYSAPEQLQTSEPLDQRTDVYGVAALLHDVLCGSPPWAAYLPAGEAGDRALVHAIAAGHSLPDPRRLNPDLPGEVAEFLSSALAADRRDRPKSAEAALAQVLGLAPLVPLDLVIDRSRLSARSAPLETVLVTIPDDSEGEATVPDVVGPCLEATLPETAPGAGELTGLEI